MLFGCWEPSAQMRIGPRASWLAEAERMKQMYKRPGAPWNESEGFMNGRQTAHEEKQQNNSGGDALKGHTRSHPEHDG